MLASGMLILQMEVPSATRRMHPMYLSQDYVWRRDRSTNCIISMKIGIYHQPGRLR